MQAKKNNDSGKNKHLTLNDRIGIAEYLAKGLSFREIARALGKSPSTISREIKRHTYKETNSFTKQPEAVCPQLAAPPFVCNGCPKKSRSSCNLTRHVYIARRAQEEYKALLKDSRSGIPLKKSSFDELDRIVSGAVRSGQHIYHITQTYHLPVSISTVYRHIKKGYFTQDMVNVIFSHVNSVKRAQFNGKSAYEMFCFTYSEELAAAMGIRRIPPEEVIQSSSLLRKLFSE